MAKGPGVDAVLRGFMALVLDMVRVDAERRPGPEMTRWYRELAEEAGLQPIPIASNRELLDEAVRIGRAVDEAPPAPAPPARRRRTAAAKS